MTELESARLHLQKAQDSLRHARSMHVRARVPSIAHAVMKKIENDFLAALSWVWDAQERATQLSDPVWCAWDFGTEDSWHKRMFMAAKATAEVLDASQGA